jgi:hypothetical protein
VGELVIALLASLFLLIPLPLITNTNHINTNHIIMRDFEIDDEFELESYDHGLGEFGAHSEKLVDHNFWNGMSEVCNAYLPPFAHDQLSITPTHAPTRRVSRGSVP